MENGTFYFAGVSSCVSGFNFNVLPLVSHVIVSVVVLVFVVVVVIVVISTAFVLQKDFFVFLTLARI